jgi:hypothetical protein
MAVRAWRRQEHVPVGNTLLATDLQSTGDNVEAIRATVARHLGPARP